MSFEQKSRIKGIIGWPITFLIGLLLVEVFARLFVSTDFFVSSFARWDSSSWRLRWIHRLEKFDTEIFQKRFLQFHPTRGWSGIPNTIVEDENMRITLNSQGFRAFKDFDPTVEKKRIFLIGDSYTFGEEVSDTETFSYFLQEKKPEYEVMNLGIGGYGLDQVLITLMENIETYKPEFIILGFVYDDIFRTELSFRDYSKPFFELDINGELILKNSPVKSPEEIIKNEWRKLKTFDLARIAFEHYRMRIGSFYTDQIELSRRILKEIVDISLSNNATPIFVYLPISYDVDPSFTERTIWEKEMFDFCLTTEIKCTTSRPSFLEHSKKYNYRFSTYEHWKGTGHKIVAETILKALDEVAAERQP